MSWCHGNAFYAGHPVVYERGGAEPVGGRCCVLHTPRYATAVRADDDADAADGIASMTREDLAAALARYEAAHPPRVADGPRSRQPRVQTTRG